MIRPLLIGAARVLFGTAVLFVVAAFGLAFLSVRLLRFAWRNDQPAGGRREALFNLAGAAVRAAQAFGVKPPTLAEVIEVAREVDE